MSLAMDFKTHCPTMLFVWYLGGSTWPSVLRVGLFAAEQKADHRPRLFVLLGLPMSGVFISHVNDVCKSWRFAGGRSERVAGKDARNHQQSFSTATRIMQGRS